MSPVLGGRYELGAAIGSGGFGTVFRAHDRQSGAELAVKLVLPGLGSDAAAARLRREGEIVRRVSSRHVARVVDVGGDDSGTWLVSELVDGAPLTVATLGRALLPHEVLRVARGLLEGLAAVHAAGVVHGDVKPSNVLVSVKNGAPLEGVKLVDFGLARVASRAELDATMGVESRGDGAVVGTARWMAPEVLAGGEPTVRSDLYSAGLLLFDLLDVGALFPVGSGTPQLHARLLNDPELADRVPEPLAGVLAQMLARDPSERWSDAREAHEAVVDLDTAPVSVVKAEETLTGNDRNKLANEAPRKEARAPHTRLTSLPADAVAALRETILHLDLPMLDALARRERGNTMGRIARALSLTLRLELDAAALVLEPLAAQSDIARAIGATVLAQRARRVTRARVDADREDRWLDSLDAELAAMLVAMATALSTGEDGERDLARCERSLARLEMLFAADAPTPEREATRTTVRLAQVAARARRGEIDRAVALDLVGPILSRGLNAPLHTVVRGLCTAALVDDARALGDATRAELELAEKLAGETGATLLDACAATMLGRLFVGKSTTNERAVQLLARASTLLAGGDVPSLEHESEHHRGAALLAIGLWEPAALALRAARSAAHAERASSSEVMSATLEVLALLALGDVQKADEAAHVLADVRLAGARGRTAALGWVARALQALAASDRDGAEDALAQAEARVREADRSTLDAYLLVEMIGVLFDADRGALPDIEASVATIARFADEHGLDAAQWLPLLRAVVGQASDFDVSARILPVLARLGAVLGAPGLVRDRPTGAPPSERS